MLANSAFVANLGKKFFDPITPVVKDEWEEVYLIVFKSLFPTQ